MSSATALIARLDNNEAHFRVQPHNIEAEQALLGAILVNNDAFYRVSDFLLPEHFFEELHRRIYELMSGLIRAGKIATPITLKTYVGELDLGGITASQYLARLAAEATTVINAQDYGRTIYDLAIRRQLIRVGEELVNVAYTAPVAMAPRAQIAASRTSTRRCGSPSTGRPAPFSAPAASPAFPRACAISTSAWAACSAPT